MPNSSLKLGTFLILIAILTSAMAVLFVLHTETDESSATRPIDSGQCGPNATYTLYSSGVLEIRGSGEMYQYDTTPAPWYECRDDITKIFVCMDITKLGASAFKDCKHATELTIPITLNSVVSDEFPAFAGCCSIEKVKFTSGNGGNGYNYTTYPVSDAWYQNTPWYQSRDVLKEVNLADDVKTIGSNAFRQLNITSIVIPDSVVHLGILCFFNCTKLTDLTIPISLNSYGSNEKYPAFRGCVAVQKVTFTNGNGVPFDYSKGWWSDVADLAPWNMYSDVGKTIIIPDNVPKLGECMFWGCNIVELSIPVSIDLQWGTYDGSLADYGSETAFQKNMVYKNLEKITLTKGSGRGWDHTWSGANACPWSHLPNLKTVIFEEGITHIGSIALYLCHVENLVLPNTLTSFGQYAFYGSTIKNLTLPISVNATWFDEIRIGLETKHPAFYNVSGIEKINFTPGSGYGFDYATNEGSNCWYQNTPWYQCRDTLKEINFAEGITHIGSDAFRELNLTSLEIPNSVGSLGQHAFYNLTDLTSLTIPATLDTVASKEYPSFDGCANIEKITFTGSGDWFDYGDSDPQLTDSYHKTPWQFSKSVLKIVEISPDVTSVGKHAFETCDSLESISIPYSLKFIGDCAFNVSFYDVDGVTKLQETADDLAGYTFKNFDGKWIKQKESGPCGKDVSYEFDPYTGTLTISGSGNMGSYSSGKAPWFFHKDSIRFIEIADTIKSIGDFAFEGTAIDSIFIPNSVESIGASAFEGCTNLATVNLGSSVNSIDETAFNGCSSLVSYVTSKNSDTYTSIDGILLSKDMTILIKYPVAKAGTFFEIPDYVKTIAPSAFNECTSLSFITIPDSVETIEKGAFDLPVYDSNCETALDLTIENLAGFTFYKVEGRWIKQNISGECGDSVFYKMDCSKGTLIISGSGQMYDFSIGGTPWYLFRDSILSVNIESSVSSIGEYAFYGCTSLTSITIPDSVSSIGKSAFFGCASLTSVTIPDSVTILQIFVFQGCTSLTSIIIPDTVKSIRSHAFYGCSSLTSVTIPDSVTTLGEQVFYGCTSLTSVTLPNFIKFIGNYTFCGCTSLSTVLLPSSIQSIGFSAFRGCTSLTSVTIPDSVESIGVSAFEGCTSLATVNLGNYVNYIGNAAFRGCTSLTTITIPDSVTSLGETVFDGTFYDTDDEKELEQTVENLAGSKFNNVGGKWIKGPSKGRYQLQQNNTQ